MARPITSDKDKCGLCSDSGVVHLKPGEFVWCPCILGRLQIEQEGHPLEDPKSSGHAIDDPAYTGPFRNYDKFYEQRALPREKRQKSA